MRRHERFEQFSMIRNSQMQKFVRNDEILESFRLIQQVNRQSDGARA